MPRITQGSSSPPIDVRISSMQPSGSPRSSRAAASGTRAPAEKKLSSSVSAILTLSSPQRRAVSRSPASVAIQQRSKRAHECPRLSAPRRAASTA